MSENRLSFRWIDVLHPHSSVEHHLEKFYEIKSEVAGEEASNLLKDLETKFATEKSEKEKGFHEAVTDQTGSNKVNFFNLGKENKWEKYLNSEDQKFIIDKLGLEMKELGYI